MSEHTSSSAGNSLPATAFGQLWQVPTFLLGLLTLCLVAANSRLLHNPASSRYRAELAQFRQVLDGKDGKLKPWLDESPRLLAAAERFADLAGEVYFLMGTLHWRLSEEGPAEQARANRSRAEEFFDKALSSGNVADGDQGQLKFRLGMVLYRLGQQPARAVAMMKEGINLGADAGSGHEFLLQAMLKLPHPNLDEALKINQRWLERCDDNEESQTRARLVRGELLMRAEKWRDALPILERIGKSASRESRLRSLYLQAQCCEADGQMWRRAQKTWELLLKEPDDVPGGKGRVLYALGLCALNNGESQPALEFWSQVVPLGGEEAQAAGLRMGEAKLAGGDAEAALSFWTEALAQVRKPADYRNAYLAIEQVREIFESAWPRMMDSSYPTAYKLADLYERVAQPARADLYRAQACEAQAQKSTGAEAAQSFDRAARAYEQAASSSPAAEQADHLWHAAECFQRARQFAAAARTLERFVKIEKDAFRLAQGWLALAESLTDPKDQGRARQAYTSCIDCPNTPSADRARCRLAQLERNAGNFARALDCLKAVSTRSLNQSAHEDAVFLQGTLLLDMKKYDLAEFHLEDAIKKHPRHAASWQGRAELADCYRKLAEQFLKKAEESITDEIKTFNHRKWSDKLSLAVSTYQNLAEELEQLGVKSLTPEQLGLLRQALFGQADVLVELREMKEAVRRYQDLQKRYRGDVESLIACERLWLCVPYVPPGSKLAEELQQIVPAALEMAEADLLKMNASDPVFRDPPGVLTKADWQERIARAREQMARPPVIAVPPR